MRRFTSTARYRGGFTLIELIVIVSIVSTLLGLLLPALSRARDASRKALCLNNLHQIMIGTTMYSNENNDEMPAVRPYHSAAWSSYNHGGRYPVDKALDKMRLFVRYPFDRPLNPYVHPGIDLGGTPSSEPRRQGKMNRGLTEQSFADPDRFNFPIFECPSDHSFNYQMEWSNDRVSHSTSAYYAVGTSYMFNMVWLQYVTSEYHDFVRPILWDEGTTLFKRARLAYPAQFIAYFDDPAYFALARRTGVPLYHHDEGRFSMAFLDGHSAISEINMDDPFKGPLFLFLEQMK